MHLYSYPCCSNSISVIPEHSLISNSRTQRDLNKYIYFLINLIQSVQATDSLLCLKQCFLPNSNPYSKNRLTAIDLNSLAILIRIHDYDIFDFLNLTT